MTQKINSALKQRGQGMVEYIIIVALIAIAGIAVFGLFGQTIKNQVSGMAEELSGKSGAAAVTAAQGNADSAVTAAGKKNNMSNYKDQDNL